MENLGYLPETVTGGETIWISADNTAQDEYGDDIVLDGYLPATHTLAYDFAGPVPVTVGAVANTGGTGWTLEVSAAITLTWRAGAINFRGRVTDATTGRVFAVDAGYITAKASPLQTSQYAAALLAIDAAILEYAQNPYGSFTIPGGINVTFRSLDDLLNLRAYYQAEVRRDSATRTRRIIRSEFRCL